VTRVVVVTGTDTDVGKTVVTAALAAAHLQRGRTVCVVKPAQTGVGPDDPGDLDEVRRLAGPVTTVEPVRLPDPLAPDLAARVAGVSLPGLEEQRRTVLAAAAGHDVVLVEGAGGVAVRLGEGWTLLDLARSVSGTDGVGLGVVVVARAGLGTLNHTVLTVQALRAAGLSVHGVVIGSWPADPGLTERLNREELPGLIGTPLLGAVPTGAPGLPPTEFRHCAAGWFDPLPGSEPGGEEFTRR
jgi:dethiobiotin synthase